MVASIIRQRALPPTSVLGPPPPPDAVCDLEKRAKERHIAAVVVMTFDRADYLRKTLDSLLSVHGRSRANKYVPLPAHRSKLLCMQYVRWWLCPVLCLQMSITNVQPFGHKPSPAITQFSQASVCFRMLQ